jgi:outer membrane protein
MKKFFFTFIGLAVLTACNNQKNENSVQIASSDTVSRTANFTIAVVNVDSILLNYKFAIQANETLMKKGEDARLTLNTKARQLSNEMEDFQKKIDNNAFLSRERAEQEAQRLQKKQADLQEHEQKLSYEIGTEQQNLGLRLQDSINLAINKLNNNKRFTIVLSTSSMNNNVLFVEDNFNITREVLDFLNKRCK